MFRKYFQKTSEEEAMDVTIEIIQALLVKLSPEQVSIIGALKYFCISHGDRRVFPI